MIQAIRRTLIRCCPPTVATITYLSSRVTQREASSRLEGTITSQVPGTPSRGVNTSAGSSHDIVFLFFVPLLVWHNSPFVLVPAPKKLLEKGPLLRFPDDSGLCIFLLSFLNHIIPHSSIQYLLVSPLQVSTSSHAAVGYNIHTDKCVQNFVIVLIARKGIGEIQVLI